MLHIITDPKASQSTVEIEKTNNLHTYIGTLEPTSNPLLKGMRYLSMYRRLIKSIGHFDLTHVHVTFPFGLFALSLKTFRKKHYIVTEHWTGYLPSQWHQISFLQKRLTQKILKKAAYVCPVSTELMEGMKSFGLSGRYAPIGNVVDSNTFCPSTDKEEDFTIIHISGLNDRQKNISGMLNAAKKLENEIGAFRWKFIGSSLASYAPLIEKLAFKEAFIEGIEHCSQEVLAVHLQQAHVCVSFSNYETFGITIAEAIACGTSVITTRTGIVDELPKDAQLTTIPISDETALAKAIASIKRNGIHTASETMNLYIKKHFGKPAIADTFSNLYQNVLHHSL